jgi:hypothetical protein
MTQFAFATARLVVVFNVRHAVFCIFETCLVLILGR